MRSKALGNSFLEPKCTWHFVEPTCNRQQQYPNKQSLGIRQTQFPHQMGWMEIELPDSTTAKKLFSASAELQATHPIFPASHLHIFATHQLNTRDGSGAAASAQQRTAELINAHIKPTLANAHHYHVPINSPALFARQPHQQW